MAGRAHEMASWPMQGERFSRLSTALISENGLDTAAQDNL